MNKNELKKVLKPLIKECIKEVIFEDGTLSSIIAEVMKGTQQATTQPIVEQRQYQSPQPRLETDGEAKARLAAKRKTLMDSIGKGAYNGVNLFEGTTPAPTSSPTESSAQGALSGVAPNDPGVDISSLMNKTSAIWSKMNEKK
jgi:hypothetical protein